MNNYALIKTHISCSLSPSPENRSVCEITWKNIVQHVRPQMAIEYNTNALRAA